MIAASNDDDWIHTTTIRLGALCIANALLAIYFCNPLMFLLNKCSPYSRKTFMWKDERGEDAEYEVGPATGICSLGYPFNWEPLNFAKACAQMVIAAFAGVQAAAVQSPVRQENCDSHEMTNGLCPLDKAATQTWVAQTWTHAIMGCVAVYVLGLAIRFATFLNMNAIGYQLNNHVGFCA